MATKATLHKNLDGYPQRNGNHLKNVALFNGPTDYDAGGVLIDGPFAHVRDIHEIQALSCSALYSVYAVVATTNPVFKFSDIRLFFIDVATGLQPADNTNLSAIKVRLVVEGT